MDVYDQGYSHCTVCNDTYHPCEGCSCHECSAAWNPYCDNVVIGEDNVCENCALHKDEKYVVCIGCYEFALKDQCTPDGHGDFYCDDCEHEPEPSGDALCKCVRCTRGRTNYLPMSSNISAKIVMAQNLHAKGHCTQGVS